MGQVLAKTPLQGDEEIVALYEQSYMFTYLFNIDIAPTMGQLYFEASTSSLDSHKNLRKLFISSPFTDVLRKLP